VEPYVPAAQPVHMVLPVVDEYCPATHAKHDVVSVAPVTEPYVPVAQPKHTELPVVIAYLPATQAKQNVDDEEPVVVR